MSRSWVLRWIANATPMSLGFSWFFMAPYPNRHRAWKMDIYLHHIFSCHRFLSCRIVLPNLFWRQDHSQSHPQKWGVEKMLRKLKQHCQRQPVTKKTKTNLLRLECFPSWRSKSCQSSSRDLKKADPKKNTRPSGLKKWPCLWGINPGHFEEAVWETI